MKLVGDFLSRFQNLTPPNDSIRRALSDALHETVNVRVTPDKISLHNGVAHIQASSVVKNVIQVHRAKILNTVFEAIPKAKESLRDIR